MAIDMAEFWGENYYGHPPLTDDMVSTAESMLGVKLPSLFIDLLKIQNGGYTNGYAYPMTVETSWSENQVPLSELFGIVTSQTIRTAQNILASAYMIEEWGLPDKQVLLTGDGHWWITLDYRKGDVPTVTWLDSECDQDIQVADSFEDFINGLVSEDAFSD